MSPEANVVYFEAVQLPDGRAKLIACDGEGDGKNSYLTLLEVPDYSDLHMSFNVRDSMLFLAFHEAGNDFGFSVPVDSATLRALGQKLLALSADTTST